MKRLVPCLPFLLGIALAGGQAEPRWAGQITGKPVQCRMMPRFPIGYGRIQVQPFTNGEIRDDLGLTCHGGRFYAVHVTVVQRSCGRRSTPTCRVGMAGTGRSSPTGSSSRCRASHDPASSGARHHVRHVPRLVDVHHSVRASPLARVPELRCEVRVQDGTPEAPAGRRRGGRPDGPFADEEPLEMRIQTELNGPCYRFLLPPSFTKPKRRIDGTVGLCDDDPCPPRRMLLSHSNLSP
jgi:hypothetical protein